MRGILPNNGNDSIQTVNASAHAIVSAGQRVQQDTVPGITAQALLEQERKLRKEAHAAYTRELEKLQAELETVCHEKLSFANLAKEAEDQLEEERELRAETQEELKKLSDKNLLLENEINKFNGILDEVLTMQEKAQDSLRKIPTKRLQMEGYMSCFTVFSHSELANATKQFDPSLKIADGNQGPVYRAHLRSMMVAVKVIEERTISGFSLFPTVRRKIDATNPGMRHPNLLSPIGGCEEPMALVYEYLPNGSLRDQLTSDAGAKRLTWEIRTRIVTEISSALIFLHSAGAANGDLKPTHILLDANFSVKIISFATKPDSYDVSYAQHCDIRQLGRIILILLADSRELSPYFCGKSSVFKRHMEMVNEIENAVRTKNVESIVDKRAGEWPKAVALKLATLCLECYRASGDDGVDLESHVQSILSAPKGQEPPSYFICPITQGITAQALLEQERKLRKEAHAAYTRELEKLQAELETVRHEKLSFANLAKEAEDQLEEERELRAETQEELKKLSDKNLLLENEINKFNGILDEVLTMQEKAQDSLRKIPTKRLQMEGYMSCFTVFSHSELANATKQFDPSLKIADGNQGPVYRAHLQSMMVAVKVIEERTISGFSLFPTVRRKIDATNPGMRHPNLLSPIGGCEEPMALVYEYLPNGSLRDQLTSDAGAKRLTWEIRTRIVTEISSALIFLHSAGAANGDLKPTHILLDANFSVKIISFATKPDSYDVSYAQHCDIRQLGRIILILLADSRELSPYFCGKSSVFKRHMEMVNEIENAVRTKNVESIVDKRAGEWPKAVALKLATLCLECYRVSGDDDVDLESHVQSILSAPKGQEPPSYFICPITQEMMKDPQVAADGFTYEREALMKWFDDGHKTSPMTNENLEHLKLTPNHALRSAIQQWLQEYSNFT